MNKKSFEEVYSSLNNEDSKLYTAYNEERKENKKINKICLIICLILDISIILMTYKDECNFSLSYMVVIFPILMFNIMIFGFASFFRKKKEEFINIYKEIVIKRLIENFYTDIEYFPNNQIDENIYNEGEYKEYYNRYYSDDYIKAKIDNKYLIDMAEVHTVEEETHRDSDGNTTTTRTTKFHGLFLKIAIDKNINSILKIMTNNYLHFDRARLEMDSSEFEKYFDVSSTNKILCMQILTPDVMQTISDFRKKTKDIFDITIINKKIYIRFHCGGTFEPQKLKKGPVEEETLKLYYNILNFIYDLSTQIIEVINNLEI